MAKSQRPIASHRPALLLPLLLAACARIPSPPLAPEEALETFRLPEGFRIELVASEPLITDPVEIAFDATGLLYVAEMEDYPAEGAPRGRIVVLEDKDGDGRYETGNTFAEGLPYVNGVMPWRNGVLVTSAPDILFLADTTGDRRADIRQVVLTGFALTNPQLRMSSLRYGPDNWIYGAYSRSGGQRGYPQFTNHGLPLRFPDDPAADSADIYPGTDFRFRPGEFIIKPSGGMSQFGLAFDAAGNRFTVWNNIHLRHVVVDARYPAENPYLNIPSAMASVSDHGDAAPVYSRAENRLDLHESEIGHFTSACGHSIYTGALFQGPYAGAVFVCEPVSNLVHADLLTRNGATFTASRDREGEEFLTSTDSWFRPVNTTVGPDGGLYVVDFYRKLVEHPAWIARADDKGIYTHAGVLQESDFLEGNDRGRIYRIVPEDFQRQHHPKPSLHTADTETLVSALDHPNMWWRTTAQRLLVESGDTTAIVPLIELLDASPSPEGKIHALWTLEGLGDRDETLIVEALSDANAAVRKQAVLLAERHLDGAGTLRDKLLSMTDDPDAHVQFQLALTLGRQQDARAFDALAEMAAAHIADPWFTGAVLFGAAENSLDWYRRAREFQVREKTALSAFLQRIASVTGARLEAREISALVSAIAADSAPTFQAAGLRGLHEGMRRGRGALKLSPQAQDNLFELIASPSADVQAAALDVAETIRIAGTPAVQRAVMQARETAGAARATTAARTTAVRVLGLLPAKGEEQVFDELLSPKQEGAVQAAAARVLGRREDTAAMALLLKRWQGYTAEVRGIVESGFTRSVTRLDYLIGALEEGVIQPSWLSRTTRSRLVQHPEKEMRQRAEKLFGDLADDRDEVVTAFYEATTLRGDAAKGKEIFKAACAACHQMEDAGRAFGPDLLSVRNQTRINLLAMILDPNKNIAPGYDGYLIETTGGRTFAGILGSESASGVVLRTVGGEEQVIARDHIKTILPMGESLMPEGLENNYTTQDMADLLEFLKKGK